jgi:5'-nucleotidase
VTLDQRKPQILLTNDDGIRSPGLWAAAAVLESLGFVSVIAPLEQSSGTGRSLPSTSSGIIEPQTVKVNGREWMVYAVGGTPAQAVLHGVLEIMPQKPDLVVSGINYGENIGFGVTVSGTVGAALEGAAFNIPSLAISLETKIEDHLSYSEEVDFSAAAYFTQYFGRLLIERQLPADVQVLKVDVPINATPQTPWQITRLSHVRYFEAIPPNRQDMSVPTKIGYRLSSTRQQAPRGTDVYAVHIGGQVSVTPLSLDLTSRVNFKELRGLLENEADKSE